MLTQTNPTRQSVRKKTENWVIISTFGWYLSAFDQLDPAFIL